MLVTRSARHFLTTFTLYIVHSCKLLVFQLMTGLDIYLCEPHCVNVALTAFALYKTSLKVLIFLLQSVDLNCTGLLAFVMVSSAAGMELARCKCGVTVTVKITGCVIACFAALLPHNSLYSLPLMLFPSPFARPMMKAMEACSIQFSRIHTARTPSVKIVRVF